MTSASTCYMRFVGPVTSESCSAFLQALDAIFAENPSKLVILLSTPGGGVFEGITIYNFLKTLPFELEIHNLGQVDSIGATIYSAGKRRTTAANARFLLHGVQANFAANSALEEPQLTERLSGLQIDTQNIAQIIASASGRTPDQVHTQMLKRTSLDPSAAIAFGLAHEVTELKIPPGAKMYNVTAAVKA